MDDLAGANIAKIIVERQGLRPTGDSCLGSPVYGKGDVLLFGTRTSVRDLTELPLRPEVCVVASRHRSESGKPTLTCHPTGNFGAAGLGGSPGRLQTTNSQYLCRSLLLLRQAKERHGLEHEVSMEVTHHGPTELPFPLLYVEVGSSEPQWNDLKACGAVADVIWEAVSSGGEPLPSAIGFGGPHYAPNFNEVVGKYAMGHIMPKHAVEQLSEGMVAQMVEKTFPRPEVAVIDWKGLKGADKDVLVGILGKIGLKWVKSSDAK
jgi:D-aminoacyl-tRNA deacylase